MNFSHFIKSLSHELNQPLPGEDAQLQMASKGRMRDMLKDTSKEQAIKSSVLILIYPGPKEHESFMVLIQRPDYDGVHGGQISLPGGKFEEGDLHLSKTAIRESEEEIGIDGKEVVVIGQLTDLYIPPSNYIVSPFVGFSARPFIFKPDYQEVAEIIEISLKDLMDKNNLKDKDIFIREDMIVHVPCFDFGGKTVWGATAMILSEFKEILKRILF